MNPKKYAQQNGKNKSLAVTTMFKEKNKENEQSITEAFYKKFSVGHHGISQQIDFLPSKKNITDEKISVCLEHSHSQNKTFGFEKSRTESDIRYLNSVIEQSEGGLWEMLTTLSQQNECKSEEGRKLVQNLMKKYRQDEKQTDRNQSIEMTDHILRPYLEQEIMLLQKNYYKLKTRGQELNDISHLNQNQKSYITQTLLKLQAEQRAELLALEATDYT